MLRRAGVEVATLHLRSADFATLPWRSKIAIAGRYHDHAYGRAIIRAAVSRHRPDVVHFHNLYPLLGPGAIAEAERLGCATVHTLHNYRLSCLRGTHCRTCERCEPGRFAAGVLRGCYRSSVAQSVLAARGATCEWQAFLERDCPTMVFALTRFGRQKYASLGADSLRVVVKSNSVDGPPEESRVDGTSRSGVLAAGRLSAEKGILPLMRVWPEEGPALTVAGDGPLRREAAAVDRPNVRYVGKLSPESLREALRAASVLVLPSLCYEGQPLVLLEALSEGTPVAGFTGSAVEFMDLPWGDRACAPYGDFRSLASTARDLAAADDWLDLSGSVRRVWHERYRHEVNVAALLRQYATAVTLRGSRLAGSGIRERVE